MKGLALLYFVSGVVYLLCGMGLGIYMGIADDHTLARAHAHLNLVGGVVFALVGLFYHATPAAAATLGARLQYGIAMIGVVLMVPGIGLVVTGHEAGLPLAIIGSLATAAAILTFLINLASVMSKPTRA